jgi:hypothetical protein
MFRSASCEGNRWRLTQFVCPGDSQPPPRDVAIPDADSGERDVPVILGPDE